MLRKLGPSMAIAGGIITFVMSTLGLLVAVNLIENQKWIGDYTSATGVSTVQNTVSDSVSVSASWLYGIAMFIGAIQFLLGIFAYKRARGLASLILLGLFGFSFAVIIIAGTRSNSWPVATIITAVMNGFASLGLLIGLLAGNRKD